MVSATGVDYHTVKRASLFNDLVDSCGDSGFLCYICANGPELPWVALVQGGEVVACLADVDRVNFCGTIGETAFCDTKADSTIGAGYWRDIRDVSQPCLLSTYSR